MTTLSPLSTLSAARHAIPRFGTGGASRGSWKPAETPQVTPDQALFTTPVLQELTTDFPSIPVRQSLNYTFNTNGQTVKVTRPDQVSLLVSGVDDCLPQAQIHFSPVLRSNPPAFIPSHITTGTRSDDTQGARTFLQKIVDAVKPQ
jgi:hypothetical protein